MIRTNSFAVLTGEGAEEELRRMAPRIGRYSRSIRIDSGEHFGMELGGSAELAVAVLALDEGDTLPIVHGFIDEAEHPSGEFSLVRQYEGEYFAERDAVGTRQLYVRKGGLGVASDFRFFDSRPEDLLAPGAAYSVRSGSIRHGETISGAKDLLAEEPSARLARLIAEAVRKRVRDCRKVGVAFSGGLDSSLIAHCAEKYSNVTLFNVHARGSKDEASSRRSAEILGLELVACPVEAADVRRELRNLDLPFDPTPMDRALWSVYSIAARAACERGVDVLLLGQLADELFGGYMKYSVELQRSGDEAARRMMEEDVRACSHRGFIRDETACARWVEPRFPFADEGVIRLALGLPVKCKISGGGRKVVLRRAAVELGLPGELTALPKKAAQYSSGVLKLVR